MRGSGFRRQTDVFYTLRRNIRTDDRTTRCTKPRQASAAAVRRTACGSGLSITVMSNAWFRWVRYGYTQSPSAWWKHKPRQLACLQDCSASELSTQYTRLLTRMSAGFWLGRSMPPCRLRRKKFKKFDYEMVHSEVYLNKYVVSIAPFSTSACPDCSQNLQKTALFCMFSLFNFSSIFRGGSADPICPYVRTPMFTKESSSEKSL